MATDTISPRQGRSAPEGPFEGVPHHLRAPLTRWLKDLYVISSNRYYSDVDDDALDQLAAELHIDLIGAIGGQKLDAIFNWAEDEERFLDLLHYSLQLPTQKEKRTERLDALLASGRSVWRATDKGLERRVDAIATAASEQAVKPQDAASEELSEAWAKAYGRDNDASDAWDHAIKAVEAVLIPIVVPGQDGAHIGHVIGQLDRQGQHWDTILRFNHPVPPVTPPFNSVQTMVGMLRLLYPNPDRHVGPDHRTVTLEEARAVVQLAVTIVQWGRDGQIVRN